MILAGSLAWCAAILLPALLAHTSWSSLDPFIYKFFQPICHQQPARSFHLFGEQLAVCSRCSSIYFAFLLGVMIFPFIRKLTSTQTPRRVVLVLVVIPMVIDVGLEFIGVHNSTFLTRALTGSLFGIVIPFFVLPAAIEGVQQLVAPQQVTIPATINEHQKGISNA